MPTYEEGWIRDHVLELYNWSKAEHEARFCNSALFWYRYYKNYVDKRVDPEDFRSNVGVGLGFPIIEIMHARLMEPWMGGDFMMSARALEEAGEDLAPVIASFVNNVLQNRVTRSMAKASLIKKSTMILGRGVAKYRLAQDRPRVVPSRQQIKMPGILGKLIDLGSFVMPQKTRPQQRFEMDYCDPFNVWGEPGVRFKAEDGNTFIFERSYMTTSAVYAEVEAQNWREPEVVLDDGLGYDDYTMRRQDAQNVWNDSPRQGLGGPRPHRILEFQGRCQTKETRGSSPTYADMKVVLINEDEIAHVDTLDTHDGKPAFIFWEPTLDPCSERAIGMIEPIEDMLLTINDFVNIALDNARKILESPLLIDPGANGGQPLVLGPAAQNFVRNPMYSVKALEMKDLPGSFFELLGWFNDLVQRISGVSDFFGGLNTSDTDRLTKTATGMSLMASLSASRFGPMLGSVDREFYRPLANHVVETSRLFMPRSEIVRMPASPKSPFAEIRPEDLDLPFEFSYNLKGLDPSAAERRDDFLKMVEFLGNLVEPLRMQGYDLDVFQLARLAMDEFGRGQEVGRIIKALDPEAAALMEMQKQQMLAQGGAPGAEVPGQPAPAKGGPKGTLPPPPAGAPNAPGGMTLQQMQQLG